MDWPALSREEIKARVFEALAHNKNYLDVPVLGLPGSVLDRRVFHDAPFAKDAPFIRTFMDNPNHIGCHTLGESEPAFEGTQGIEREVIALCAEAIMGAAPGTVDGYVASGGTESNLQAIWEFRSALQREHDVRPGELAILCTEDTHYSVYKAGHLMGLPVYAVPVQAHTRALQREAVVATVERAQASGARAFAVVLTMGTTLFGSVDDADTFLSPLSERGLPFLAHVDAAFGGFILPFSTTNCPLTFRDPRISTITMDAHKMLQAPYGTGIHLARKGLIEGVCTKEAAYVRGKDYTLCGSRSGANAVAIWMILNAYGAEGGRAFIAELLRRTDHLCTGLEQLEVSYFRAPGMNVVAIAASQMPREVAEAFLLVPDTHEGPPRWWKVLVMDHVTDALLDRFLEALAKARVGR